MSTGQFAREIAVLLADHIRAEARRIAVKHESAAERSALRQERRRLKASDDWIDQRIYQLYLRNQKA